MIRGAAFARSVGAVVIRARPAAARQLSGACQPLNRGSPAHGSRCRGARAATATALIAPRALAAGAKPTISVTFVKPTGEKVTVKAPIGDSMLEVAHANSVDIEGACGALVAAARSLACGSTEGQFVAPCRTDPARATPRIPRTPPFSSQARVAARRRAPRAMLSCPRSCSPSCPR